LHFNCRWKCRKRHSNWGLRRGKQIQSSPRGYDGQLQQKQEYLLEKEEEGKWGLVTGKVYAESWPSNGIGNWG